MGKNKGRVRRVDVSGLVDRITREGSAEDVAVVVGLLSGEHDAEDTYWLLQALGRAGRVEHEVLVAGFLEYREEPTVAALALRVLCRHWGLADRYADRIREFLYLDDGVLSPRSVAISLAGEYLRDRRDAAMLERLVELAGEDGVDWIDRKHALTALATALGYPHSARVRGADGERILVEAVARLAGERV
jgi:hypothetical protein